VIYHSKGKPVENSGSTTDLSELHLVDRIRRTAVAAHGHERPHGIATIRERPLREP